MLLGGHSLLAADGPAVSPRAEPIAQPTVMPPSHVPAIILAGGEGGLISKAINDAMERGASPIGATVPCYQAVPGGQQATMPGISAFTECVLVPKNRAEVLVRSGAVPAAPYHPIPSAGRLHVVPEAMPGR